MIIEFEKEYLKQLFTTGKTDKKKYSFQPQVVKQYIKTVNILRNAANTEVLYQFASLHYEKKSGNMNNIEAVWVNKQYRLEFKTRSEGKEPDIITICSLTDLSNHYK